MKAIIMAGGKGTRISSVAENIPKPMINICGKPVLEHEIECLKRYGFADIIITVSHLREIIMNYFGDGRDFGVKLHYFIEEKPLGNAGALYELRLKEDFLLINADSIFDIDIERFVKYHYQKRSHATIFTHPNSHPYDSGLIVADENNSVLKWIAKEEEHPIWYKNRVNAGIHIISSKVLLKRPDKEKIDLDRDILRPLAGSGKLFCYDSTEYVKDMGTPERYRQVCQDFEKKIVEKRNLNKKQKAIFLDRDGTINRYVGFLRNINDFFLLPDVGKAIHMINNSGYLAIVVTNQPIVARGEATFEELEEIHKKMETLLGREGAYLDAIYYCPHHPDKGFAGEIHELKKECECRKPKPGMLIKAAQEYNIDLSKSWMIGDSDNDIFAGQRAGCKTVKIETNSSMLNVIKEILKSGE